MSRIRKYNYWKKSAGNTFAGKLFAMMVLILLSTLFSFAQQHNTQPDVRTEVHKELDEQGNVIRYDSTYSWSYSGTDSTWAGVMPDIDSMMQQLGASFDFNPWEQDFFSQDAFASPFSSDSTGGFQEDFFFNSFQDFETFFKQQEQWMQQHMQDFPFDQQQPFLPHDPGTPNTGEPEEESTPTIKI